MCLVPRAYKASDGVMMMVVLKLDPGVASPRPLVAIAEVGPWVAGPGLRMSRTGSRGKSRTGSGELLAVAGAGAAGGLLAVAVLAVPGAAPHRLLAVDLHVLPQAGGVGVRLVAASHLAVVRLVRGVDV